ncbi:MAG TPA: hypothetical protein VH951_06085 [Dehalococcoidia bacterium]|jgi:hypothetical protein
MDYLLVFGSLAVGLMLATYALELRSSMFTLAFAVSCAMSSLYGWAVGAYPFGVVEAVWAVVAFRRWQMRVSGRLTIAAGR